MVLQDLDDAGLVRRFHVGPERLGVKLTDGEHHLILAPEHVTLASLATDSDLDMLSQAAAIVWRRLRPSGASRAEMNPRFVTAAPDAYDLARRKLSDGIARWPKGIDNVDSAVFLDLRAKKPEADIHVEYGIVEPSEAAIRLATQQPPVMEDAEVHPSIFPLKSLPDAALLDYQNWRLATDELAGVDDLFGLWSRIRGKAEEIDVSISDRLLGDADEQRNGSPDA